jgi:protein TonB
MSEALPIIPGSADWDGGAAARARLWSSAMAVALGLHAAGILGMALFRSAVPVNDMPAGTFMLDLAAFGGNPDAAAGGGAKAAPAPQPEVKEVPPPKPVERKAEVALPKPEKKIKPNPEPPHPAAPSPDRPIAADAPPSTQAPSDAVADGTGGQAGLSGGAGGGGGLVSGRLGGGGTGLGTPLGRYKVLVFQALWAQRRYPPVAQRMGYQGDVQVEFTVNAAGDILASKILSGSGYPVLDREGEAILHRVRRFPPFPADLHFHTLTFRVAIPFQLT